jgi:signal transduction histidine kinase
VNTPLILHRIWPFETTSPRPKFHLPAISFRVKVTLVYIGLVAGLLVLFSALVYMFTQRSLFVEVVRGTRERADRVNQNLVSVGEISRLAQGHPLDPGSAARFTEFVQEAVDPFRDPGVYVRVVTEWLAAETTNIADHETLITHLKNAQAWVEISRGLDHDEVLDTPDGRFYVFSRPLWVDGRIRGMIQVGTSLASYDRTMRSLARRLFLGGLVGIVLAAALGTAVTGTVLRTIDEVTRTAQRITRDQDLSQRLKTTPSRDELGRLAETFNDMLDRIESLFKQQQRFTADISHELRTPLTTIRGELELMQRSGQAEADSLAAVRQEAERMSRLVGDLLLLARADAGFRLACQPVELCSLLLDIYRQARTLAQDRLEVALTHEDVAVVDGDEDRLRQLLLNLAENAVRYTPAGGRVSMGLYTEPGWARIEVSDTGLGIAEVDLPHVFDRFYRVDSARGRGGTGLGLAIAQWIAHAHGGRIEVRSALGRGSCFTVRLPLAGTA